MGELAQDNETLDPMDTVNDAVVLRKFAVLSGEICLTCNGNLVVNPVLAESGDQRPGLPGSYRLSGAMNTNHDSTRQHVAAAPLSAMRTVIKQKSAEAIVAQRRE